MPKTINTAIEDVPLSRLKFHPRNANQGDFGAIQQSVEANGFYGTIVANKRTGHILAGNHRYAVAKQMGFEKVPVSWVDVDDEQELRILIADNRTTRLGIDNETQLAELLSELAATPAGLLGTGFDGDDLDDLIGKLAGETKELLGDPHEVPEPPVDPITKPGDLWILGEHRLLCGDSTKTEDIERLGRHKTLFYDPPWDIEIPAPHSHESILAFTDGGRAYDIVRSFGAPQWIFAWDCVSSWYTPNRPLKRMKICFWYGEIQKYKFDGAHYGDSGEPRNVQNTRGSYEFVPDPRGKHLSDVFSLPITRFHSESEHSHSKPIDWLRMLIANCTEGDVLDICAGAGSCLIACEMIGRRCDSIEINPQYCDMIVKRWETLTGQKAVLEANNAKTK